MKKVIVFSLLLIIVAFAAIGQVVDSTLVGPGEAATNYLKDNLVIIIPLLVGLVDAVLAQVPKFRSSSMLQFLWNMIIKILYKRFEIPTTKANHMTVDEIAKTRGVTNEEDIVKLKTIL